MRISDFRSSASWRIFSLTALTFLVFTVASGLGRLLFLLMYCGGLPAAGKAAAMWHGLPMDMTVSGYLSAVPFLLAVADAFRPGRWCRIALSVYFALVSLLYAAVFILDFALYGYWHFRLDVTPVFYFTSSPAAAMASVPGETVAIGAALVLLVAGTLWKILSACARMVRRHGCVPVRGVLSVCAACGTSLLVGGLLFLCIRGGWTVSTMNPGRVYFCSEQRLNHAALNPVFSLLYSASHQDNFADAYRYMEDDEALSAVRILDAAVSAPEAADSVLCGSMPPLVEGRPDVYLIILESFSSHLFPSMGGSRVAMRLDSLAARGAVWTRMYASGFRTDRGIPAILSGQPSLPDASVMKYPRKAERLPGLAGEMNRQGGYEPVYYYGGDAGFTNMQGYLMAGGFSRVVSDVDFPLSSRLSKWGAHDDVLFRRVLEECSALSADAPPRFAVIQTSSSHEPFEVPYADPAFSGNPAANAFAFTDSVAADFITRLRATPRGGDALVVLVPDHWGAWPGADAVPDLFSHHLTPMIMLGGALPARLAGARFDSPASQTDVPATLLALLGMQAGAFRFSHNLLDPAHPRYAWMSDRDMVGIVMVLPDGRESRGVYNIEGDADVISEGGLPSGLSAVDAAKAYLRAICLTLHAL